MWWWWGVNIEISALELIKGNHPLSLPVKDDVKRQGKEYHYGLWDGLCEHKLPFHLNCPYLTWNVFLPSLSTRTNDNDSHLLIKKWESLEKAFKTNSYHKKNKKKLKEEINLFLLRRTSGSLNPSPSCKENIYMFWLKKTTQNPQNSFCNLFILLSCFVCLLLKSLLNQNFQLSKFYFHRSKITKIYGIDWEIHYKVLLWLSIPWDWAVLSCSVVSNSLRLHGL